MTKSRKVELRAGPLVLVAAAAALSVAGCKHMEPGTRVAGWTLIDAAQRHPIMVSQQPTELTLRVPRGSSGLVPSQRSKVLGFYSRFRATDTGNGRIILKAPSGAANELAAMHAAREIGALLESEGADRADILVEAYHSESDPQPPVILSFMQYVAEAPECGDWPTNLASDPTNVPYPNFGCATQRNFANQIANASDLLHPRGLDERSSERRDVLWNNWLKGETTAAKKTEDERIETRKE